MPQWNVEGERFARVSIWRQKSRLRVYVNETKLMDVPRFFNDNKPYGMSFTRNFFRDCQLLISDIKFAVGAPDTRNKLISEGRFYTSGILFAVNSDKVLQTSVGILKEIAAVLQENPGIAIKIVGHTDSDGDENENLVLSQKRAFAVKQNLVSLFGIDASRLQTEGKGETVPIEANITEQGKANNRRVEFIKL
jgi:outer membrane protein OmpA-like peptidoglycan-associated protein